MNKNFWDDLREWAPECVEDLSRKSVLFQEKFIE
jgi:hypothetical protein